MASTNVIKRRLKAAAQAKKMSRTLCLTIRENLGRPLETYCEVGVLEGDTAYAVLKSLKPKRMTLVDTWKPYPSDRPKPPTPEWDKHSLRTEQDLEEMYLRVLCRFKDYPDVNIVPITSLQYASKTNETKDVIFIDADHRYETTKWDIEAYWPLVKPGGMLLGHDYNARAEKSRGYWGVKKAVEEFAKRNNLEVNLCSSKIWWIQK